MEIQLQKLGLTERQAHIYIALIRMGASTIGKMENKLHLHKQTLYNELEKLISEGLVLVSLCNKRKNFHAVDPEVFVQKNEQEKKILDTLVPGIHALHGFDQGVSEINVYEGVPSVQAFHRTKIKKYPEGGGIRILGGGGHQFVHMMEPNNALLYYDGVRERKNISQRMMMHEHERGKHPKYTDNRYKVQGRYLQNEVANVMAFQIWHDCVAMLFFLEKPKLIEIKSRQAMDSFGKYFDILWKQAKL